VKRFEEPSGIRRSGPRWVWVGLALVLAASVLLLLASAWIFTPYYTAEGPGLGTVVFVASPTAPSAGFLPADTLAATTDSPLECSRGNGAATIRGRLDERAELEDLSVELPCSALRPLEATELRDRLGSRGRVRRLTTPRRPRSARSGVRLFAGLDGEAYLAYDDVDVRTVLDASGNRRGLQVLTTHLVRDGVLLVQESTVREYTHERWPHR